MGSWSGFLFAYLLGGLTFIPLVLLTIFFHALYTFPKRSDLNPEETPNGRKRGASSSATDGLDSEKDSKDDLIQAGDDTDVLDAAKREEKRSTGASERMETASGYFAVCREYTPMGINAKPIERATPMGSTTVAAPSQSVYQTMYRSIFDRKAAPAGTVENSSMSQRPKKAGNVFYVVLR